MSAVVATSAQAPVLQGASNAAARKAGSGDAFGQLLKGAAESAESADSAAATDEKRRPAVKDANRERQSQSNEAVSGTAGSVGVATDASAGRNATDAAGIPADATGASGGQPSTAAVAGQALAEAQVAAGLGAGASAAALVAPGAVVPAAPVKGVAAPGVATTSPAAQGSPSLVPTTGTDASEALPTPSTASPVSVVTAMAPSTPSDVLAAPAQSGVTTTSAGAASASASPSAVVAAVPVTRSIAPTAGLGMQLAEPGDGDPSTLGALAASTARAGAPAGSAPGGQDARQSAKEGGSRVASDASAASATAGSAASAAPATAAVVPEAAPLASAPAADPAPLASRPEQQAAPAAPASAIAPTPPTTTPLQAVVPASPTTASESAPAAAPANAAPDLPAQLSRPLFTLASAGRGEHVMTVHVTPEALGPVTVRAHVGAAGVHVELFAPTDGGRDALRSILPDLRRDLSGAGLSGSLDLSSQNQPSPNGDERPAWLSGGQRNASGDRSGNAPRASADPDQKQPRAPRPGEPVHTIDLVV